MNTKLNTAVVAAIAALAFTGTASAQSHSVTNMANPPQTQSDTKAGTEATPGRTATAEKNTSKQKDKNGGKGHTTTHNPKSKAEAKKDAAADAKADKKADSSGASTSAADGSPVTGDRVDAGTSATSTKGMGAGNGDGGAEGAMEIKPSDAYVNPVERRALDSAPKSGKMPGKE
jgi:hypothetical protein